MANEELDRNDAATPHKLEEARKRGQVAKSADVISLVVLLTAVAYLSSHAFDLLRTQFRFDYAVLTMATVHARDSHVLWQLCVHAIQDTLHLLLPLLMAVVLAAIVSNLAQTGFIFSTIPLKPDWQRINPATGFKRLFSMRTLFEAARACVKLVVLLLVTASALTAMLPAIRMLVGATPLTFVSALTEFASSIGWKLCIALVVIALLDYAYTRREYAKKMRMSRREIRDEVKHREGDPRIRSRMREIRRELLKRTRSLGKAREADIVVTNPTHVAVALKYRHGHMDAPVVLTKGRGALAGVIRSVAAKHRIPVVQSPRLARALYAALEPDQAVPPQFYGDLAPLMVWLIAAKEMRT
jgi:flagellar biosynthesis protein FlhB